MCQDKALTARTDGRAAKYRLLAETEADNERAAALLRLAEEAERGRLHFADRTSHAPCISAPLQPLATSTPLGSVETLPENIRTYCDWFFSPEARETV
jgi:hypothetical protein